MNIYHEKVFCESSPCNRMARIARCRRPIGVTTYGRSSTQSLARWRCYRMPAQQQQQQQRGRALKRLAAVDALVCWWLIVSSDE